MAERGLQRGLAGALRDDAARLRLIADNLPAMSIAYDETLHCVFANRRFAEYFGLTTASIVGKHLREIIGEGPYQEVKWAFDEVLAGRRSAYQRTRVLDNGEKRYLEVELIPNIAPDGGVRGLFAVTSDVTERRREEQLRTLGHVAAALIPNAETSQDAVAAVIRAICETEGWECGRFLQLVGTAMRQAGAWGIPDAAVQAFLERASATEHHEGLGLPGIAWQTGRALWVPDATEDPRALQRAAAPDFTPRGTFAFPVKSGGATIGVFVFNSRERRPAEERVLAAIVAIGDQIGQFLERKRAEERLRQSESRFRTLVESANEGIIVYGPDAQIVSVNSAAERILGLPRERLIGSPGFASLLSCVREDGTPVTQHNRGVAIAMRGGEPPQPQVIAIHRGEDATTWVTVNTALLRLPEDREPYGAVVTITEITKLKREEQLLRLAQRIAHAFDACEDLRSALEAMIRAVCESERWEWGRYLEAAGDRLRHFADWCIDEPQALRYIEQMRDATYAPGFGLVGTVWTTRAPLWVADSAGDPRVGRPQAIREAGARAALVVPVLGPDAVTGVLIFQCRRVRAPDERLLQAMQLLGGQIGQLVRRAKAEEAVRQSEARFRSLCLLSSDIFWEQDAEFRLTAVTADPAAFDASRLLGKTLWEIGYTNMSDQDWTAHRAQLAARRPFRDLELCFRGRSGREAWYSVSGEPVVDAAGRLAGYRGVGRDITARKLDERRIQHLATHDALTGLPNRAAFSTLLNAARENAQRHRRSLAVMFLDLDRFKVINDSLGHQAGDEVLCEVARRLRHTLRASDVVARLGGDEFVVMLPELDDASHAEVAARKVLAALVKPMAVAGRELAVSGSVGICFFPRDGKDEQALMKCADAAMYLAKEAGKNSFAFYSRTTEHRTLERFAMETSLRGGLERGEFFLQYQPRVALAGGAITCVEALVRWRHPELGIVSPADFIPLAEETGAIHELGRWVLDAACAQAARWAQAGVPVRVAVNVSARQFARDELVDQVRAALAASGLPAERLELEVTESLMAQDLERSGAALERLRALGARIALDDFGTGYSSLSQLKRLHANTLKIDKAFVASLPDDPDDAAIADAIIGMGRSLRLTVVAEGVERPEQREFLRVHGCDELQGYLVSPPLDPADCERLLREAAASSTPLCPS